MVWAMMLMWAPVARSGLFLVSVRSTGLQSQASRMTDDSTLPCLENCFRAVLNSLSSTQRRLSSTITCSPSALGFHTGSRTAAMRPSPELSPLAILWVQVGSASVRVLLAMLQESPFLALDEVPTRSRFSFVW